MSRRMKYILIGGAIACVAHLVTMIFAVKEATDEPTSSVPDRLDRVAMRQMWDELKARRP